MRAQANDILLGLAGGLGGRNPNFHRFQLRLLSRRGVFGERLGQRRATRETTAGVLGKRPFHGRAIFLGQGAYVRRRFGVLQAEPGSALPTKGDSPGQQLLIDDRQAVLVAVMRGVAFEHLRRRVERRQTAHHGERPLADILDQPEVRDLHAASDQQQVLGFDVQMLQLVFFPHVVQGFGRIVDVDHQLFPRNSGKALLATGDKALFQTGFGQLGDDHQLTVDDLNAFERQQERVTHVLDAVQRLKFAFGAIFVEVAVNELDGLDESARRIGRPDFAVTAGAQAGDQPVASDRFVRLRQRRH